MKIPHSVKRSLRFIYKIVDDVLMFLFSLLVILMCVLIKLSDISASNISVLLGRSRSAISKAKAKLQVKFLGRSCEPGEFDAFLRSL